MGIIENWRNYLSDVENGDPYQFASLLLHLPTPDALMSAFGDLPGGDQLISRIQQVRSENKKYGAYYIAKEENYLSRAELRDLAERYADSVVAFLRKYEMGDIAKSAKLNMVKFIDYDVWEGGIEALGDEFSPINDSLEGSLNYPPLEVGGDGLWEAIYAMTNVPEVAWYMIEPVSVTAPLDCSAVYKIWAGGARVFFGNNNTFIVTNMDYALR